MLYELDGQPSLKVALPIGLQHVFAMFTGNLAPILILAGVVGGVSQQDQVVMIQCAMLMAGIMTIIQVYPIKIGKFQIGSGLPVVMGTSFAFVPVMKTVGSSYGIPGVLGAAFLGGFIELIFGIFIRPLKRFFPPVVIGSVLIAIGISLLSIGANYFAGGVGAPDYGSWQNLLLGFVVFSVITGLNRFATGTLKTVAILVGIAVGYLMAIFMGKVDFTPIAQASWFSLPRPMYFVPEFHLDAVISFAAVYIIVALETMGNTAGITMATMDRDTTPSETSGSIVAAAIGAKIGALFNALPMAAFGQNAGIVSMTRVINRYCIAVAGIVMLVAALCPKIGAVFSSLPASVLGGAVITVFAMIFLNGVKMISQDGFSEENNIILAITFGLGYGLGAVPEVTSKLPTAIHFVFGEPITSVCLVAVIANLIFMPSKSSKEETLAEEDEDESYADDNTDQMLTEAEQA